VETFENPNELYWHIQRVHVKKKKVKENTKGDLAELQQRFDVIIQEWEEEQQQHEQQMEEQQVRKLAVNPNLLPLIIGLTDFSIFCTKLKNKF